MRLRLALPLLILPTAAAAAPSFDCTKARTPVEQAVCADAGLAALDSAMAALYRTRLAAVAEAERAALGEAQRRWRQARDACAPGPDLPACVAEAYRARIAELEAAEEPEPPWLGELLAAPAALGRCLDAAPSAHVLVTGAVTEDGRLRVALRTPTGRSYLCTAGQDGAGLAALHDGEPQAPGPAAAWGEPAPGGCAAARPLRDDAGRTLGWLVPEACQGK
jgi:uncharacterized protein